MFQHQGGSQGKEERYALQDHAFPYGVCDYSPIQADRNHYRTSSIGP